MSVEPVLRYLYLLSIVAGVSSVCNLGRDSYTLTDWTGSLNSPGYTSASYPDNQKCTWTIKVSKGSRIRLTFTLFQLEDGADADGTIICYDRVQILEGDSELLNACGSQLSSPTIESSTNEVTVIFTSDEKLSKSGFRLEYTGLCSMEISDNTIIETPNYPNSPPDDVKCEWNIEIPKKYAGVIQLNNQTNNLPTCNISPLLVMEAQGAHKTHNLCLVESKSLLFKDVVLTYDSSDGNVPWNGSLRVDFITNPICEYFCVNYKECFAPRGLHGQGYRCVCKEGYAGRNCDVRQEIVDPCYPKTCQNDGTCVKTRGQEFGCNCPENFTGEMCEIAMDSCFPNVCLNNGSCEDVLGKPVCSCPQGFTGDRCEVQVHPCDANPCQNGATCVPDENKYQCSCAPNYSGRNCEVVVDTCRCQNGGTCQLILGEPSCVCPKEFTGTRCESEINPCDANPCQNGGRCEVVLGESSCVCQKKFTGRRCESIINLCDANPCKNGATCVTVDGNYTCTCPPNFTGRNCEVVVDTCRCQNGGTCEVLVGESSCVCPKKFTGKLCESLINPCDANPCKNGATCVPMDGTYTCACTPNFTGKDCGNEVDPCFPNTCQNNGQCILNTIGEPGCVCKPKYTGKRCENIVDPCENQPCANGGVCTPAGTSFKCACAQGFTGSTCDDSENLCSPDTCMNSGVCKSGKCLCPSGFTGPRCEIEMADDPCLAQPCLNDGLCITTADSFVCNCPPAFVGKTCEISVSTCKCLNGGSCDVIADGSTNCVCPEGFKGALCEISDPCGSDPCLNGSTCVEVGKTYRCECRDYFGGRNCDIEIHPCASDPCQNGGTCQRNGMQLFCKCTDGYTGIKCEIEKDPCDKYDCMNGGICTALNKKPVCACPNRFSGERCENKIDFCQPNPCENGRVCSETSNGFQCECLSGEVGPTCATTQTICERMNFCQNGGTCEESNGGISCRCPPGFTGYMCSDVAEDGCSNMPCEHGQCIDEDGKFKCECDEDYRGRYCHIHKDDSYCAEDRDDVKSSNILWLDTETGQMNSQPCPTNVMGNAKRSCVKDVTSPTGGRWTRPDLSFCVRPQFVKLLLDVNAANPVTIQSMKSISKNLVSITSAIGKDEDEPLYPGDLTMASFTVNYIANGLKDLAYNNSQPPIDVAVDVAENIVSSMDVIVDPKTETTWLNARAAIVVDSVKLLLNSSEEMAEYFDKTMTSSRTKRDVDGVKGFNFKGKNLEIRVSEMKSGSGFINEFTTDHTSSITLPESILAISRTFTDNVNVYSARFSSVASLVSMKEMRFGDTENKTESQVNSDIISSKILGVPEEKFQRLPDPVIITFKLKEPTTNIKDNHCVFMNMTSKSEADDWSRDGCSLHSYNETHVTCNCSHLTNFALLLDVYGTSEKLLIDETNNSILSYISYIGGSLSILGCLAAIIVFEYFRLKSDRIRIHEQLAVSIIVVQIVFLIGVGRTNDKTTTPLWACKTVAVLLHYCLTALFCWMLVEGIHIYVVLVKVFKRGSQLKKYMALGWGVPVVIVGISFGVFYESYGAGKICWLDRDLLLMCFVPTVGLVLIINTVILGIVIRVMVRSMNSTAKVNVQEISSLRISLKAAVVLLPLLGLTWILAFLAVNTDGTQGLAYAFTYLFTIGNAFQGLLFFIFHCVLNVDVRSAFERRYLKQKTMDTSSSRARKSSEADTYAVDGKGTITPKFVDIIQKSNNTLINNKPNFNRNINFKDYDDEEDHKMWRNISLDDDGVNNQFVLRLRPSEDDPVVSECLSDIEDYLEKPSRSSVHFSSTT